MKRFLPCLLALLLLGCQAQVPVPADPTPSAPTPEPVSFADPTLLDSGYTDRDLRDTWEDQVNITLADDASSANGPGIDIDGNVVTITKEGTYLLSGTLSAGQIRVILPGDNDKAQLVLDGVNVTCPNGPALYVVQADKVFVTLAPGSENFLSDGIEYDLEMNEDEPNAALFSKDDLTINGTGALTVAAHYRHGILSKDSLVIAGGVIAIDAPEDALRGRDSVAIREGKLTLAAGGDGIQSNNDEDSDRGWVAVDGGEIAITAGNDGIQAETILQITGGTLQITAGGGSETVTREESWQRKGMPPMLDGGPGKPMPENGEDFPAPPEGMIPPEGIPEPGNPPQMSEGMTPPEGMPQMRTPPQMPDKPEAEAQNSSVPSAKGLKAGTLLRLHGGTVTLDCADDALHSNGDVTITGGIAAIRTGDDGIHADKVLSLAGGSLTVSVSREGLEGGHVRIFKGTTVDITARDDGINAAGGSDDTEESDPFGPDQFKADGSSIEIAGGTVRVNAGGDGLDSNGDVLMTGGLLQVDGPILDLNGPLDYNGEAQISGGTAILVGSGGMAQGFHESSEQFSRLFLFDETLPAGTTLTLIDLQGNLLLEFTCAKEFSSAVLSAPGMTAETALYINGMLYEK